MNKASAESDAAQFDEVCDDTSGDSMMAQWEGRS